MSLIQVNKPKYTIYKLIPNKSIRNQGTYKIARAINSVHKSPLEIFKLDGRKLVINMPHKVGYFMRMMKSSVEFYLIIPKGFESYFKDKLSDVWTNITMEEVDEVPRDDGLFYQLVYLKEDGLSIAVDRRSNDLLNSTLSVVESLEEGDVAGVFYNFIPTSQYGWKYKHKSTIDKARKRKPIERDKTGLIFLLKMVLSLIDSLMINLSEAIGGKRLDNGESVLTSLFERDAVTLSDETIKKGNLQVINTQILVYGKSSNQQRQRNIAKSMVQSFDSVIGDNELVGNRIKIKFNPMSYSVGKDKIKVSDLEAQNFIALAGRDLLEQYKFVEHVETHETEVPEDLRQGVMCIGVNKYRGREQVAYLSNDEQFRNLLTLLIGPTRAGKSNLIANLVIDAIEAGECAIIFDFIENCELSDEIARLFPNDKVLEIRCDDFNNLQGLGYNEVGVSNDKFKQYENAKRQTSNMLTLVNSIHADDSRLSPKMERYLESASLVVFISGGSIRDVFGVLQNHKTRKHFLDRVPKNQYENMSEYMESLMELDDYDKDGVLVGTKLNLVIGIIDRMNILKRNTYVEMMLKRDTKNNINLVKEMQKNQLITIKMPQNMFTTDGEKDIFTTYWITKIWLALQIRADMIRDRKDRVKVNLIIDELYQVENTEKFLTSKLSQIAKFIMKPIVSCHYINQLRFMREELRSANTSYMLISGCDKKNFDELKNELYPFTEDDLRDLPRYHSLNYIKCKDGYARFITKLPGDVKKRRKAVL